MTETATPILTTAAPAQRMRGDMAKRQRKSPVKKSQIKKAVTATEEVWLDARSIAELLDVKISRVRGWLDRGSVFSEEDCRLSDTTVNGRVVGQHREVRASVFDSFELPRSGPKSKKDLEK